MLNIIRQSSMAVLQMLRGPNTIKFGFGKKKGDLRQPLGNFIKNFGMELNNSEGKYLANHQNHPDEKEKAKDNLENNKDQPILSIIHFNDSYDIQPKYGSRGICNFKAQVQELRKEFKDSLFLFSGDCLSPSMLTNIKEGWQMVHCINTLNIDVACYGNHQFDFEIDHTLKLAKACNFPWLLGNITFASTGELLGDGQPYLIKNHKGLRVGIMGVAGCDWIGILNEQYENALIYEDGYDFANRTAKYLRQVQKCDVVIALTHQRNAVDLQFPKYVEGVDLVLGGHDHVVMQKFVEGVPVIKSGTNFNNVGLIHFYDKIKETQYKGKRFNYEWKIYKVPEAAEVDQELKKYIDDLMQEYQHFDEVIAYTDVDLETRFTKIRREQSNYGSFLADLARLYYDSDMAAINSGMVRNDMVIKPGRLTYSKVANIIDSPMVVKQIKGKNIRDMIEVSVANYPNFSGQFLFISGFSFEFDPDKTPRVQSVKVGQNPLDLQRQYSICLTSYQAKGGDNFTMLKDGPYIIDEVKGTTMLNLLLKFFKAPDTHQEYQSIKLLEKQGSNKQSEELPQFPQEHLQLVRKVSVRMGRIKQLRSRFVLNDDGRKLTSINPSVGGRIKCLKKQE